MRTFENLRPYRSLSSSSRIAQAGRQSGGRLRTGMNLGGQLTVVCCIEVDAIRASTEFHGGQGGGEEHPGHAEFVHEP